MSVAVPAWTANERRDPSVLARVAAPESRRAPLKLNMASARLTQDIAPISMHCAPWARCCGPSISHNHRRGGKNEVSALSLRRSSLSRPPKPKIILGVRWWIWVTKSLIAGSTVLNSVRPVSAAAAIHASKIIPISHLRPRASARKAPAHLLKFPYRPQRKHNVIQPHRPLRGAPPGRG